ncbi:MAG: 8-oxoguanine deaminase, partial [Nocardioides sp.]|nr:8-oxoguanine deaminase [Nocardioides sp.]
MSGPSYLLERAWVDDAVRDDVLVAIEEGRFTSVTFPGRNSGSSSDASREQREFDRPPGGAHRVPGLSLPGLANCHSHAFHRALRGRTQRE